jgi:hypothetical protein
MLVRVSFLWFEAIITIGGTSLTALKKLYGAKLTTPSLETVDTQPIGRGETIALKGS